MVGPHQSSRNDESQQPRRGAWRRWLPLGIIAVALVLVFAFDIDEYASFRQLRDHHQHLTAFVAAHYVQAALVYVVLYVLFVMLSLPGAAWATIAGGFLFGAVVG